jgi:hypothetical protein
MRHDDAPCPLEEAVDREERAHAHDREEQDDRRVVDGLGRLVGRDRADRHREHRADDRPRRAVEPREAKLPRGDQRVGDAEDDEPSQHGMRRGA